MYLDSSSSDDCEEEYHSEACTEDLHLGLPEKNPKKKKKLRYLPSLVKTIGKYGLTNLKQ